jgi:hypothetical protein
MCAATAADSNDTLSVTVTDGLPFPLDIGLVIPGTRIVARTWEQRMGRCLVRVSLHNVALVLSTVPS